MTFQALCVSGPVVQAIKVKQPSNSLALQQGLGEAISGEVLPPYVVHACD